jgi:hypothetical protein
MMNIDDKLSCGHILRHSLSGIFVASNYVRAEPTSTGAPTAFVRSRREAHDEDERKIAIEISNHAIKRLGSSLAGYESDRRIRDAS